MKKQISVVMCLLIILSTTFCITACKSRTDEMVDLEIYTTKQMNKTKKQVIKCINKQDKEGLKKLFSKDAQKHIEDLDGKLDKLIGAFNGNKIESVDSKEPAFKGSEQTQPLHIYGDYTLKLSNGKKYILFINICDMDDDYQEKRGLFQLSLLAFSDEEIPENFRRNTTVDDYGIFVYTLEEAQNQ
mgnify:CR=1 FL=1